MGFLQPVLAYKSWNASHAWVAACSNTGTTLYQPAIYSALLLPARRAAAITTGNSNNLSKISLFYVTKDKSPKYF